MTANVTNTIDVRTIVPRERHPLIFNTFHDLAPGDAIVVGLATTKSGPAAGASPLGQTGPGGRRF